MYSLSDFPQKLGNKGIMHMYIFPTNVLYICMYKDNQAGLYLIDIDIYYEEPQ